MGLARTLKQMQLPFAKEFRGSTGGQWDGSCPPTPARGEAAVTASSGGKGGDAAPFLTAQCLFEIYIHTQGKGMKDVAQGASSLIFLPVQ